jgi:ABC-type uncharacterized transport system auxiliary subunit
MRTLLRPRFVGLALGLALLLGCFPSVAEARMVGSLPSGAKDVTARQAREAEVQRLLAQEKVAQALASAGLTVEQVRSKLHRLDDAQLDQLAQHLETIESGQGTSSLLVMAGVLIVLAVVLIYMLVEQA